MAVLTYRDSNYKQKAYKLQFWFRCKVVKMYLHSRRINWGKNVDQESFLNRIVTPGIGIGSWSAWRFPPQDKTPPREIILTEGVPQGHSTQHFTAEELKTHDKTIRYWLKGRDKAKARHEEKEDSLREKRRRLVRRGVKHKSNLTHFQPVKCCGCRLWHYITSHYREKQNIISLSTSM